MRGMILNCEIAVSVSMTITRMWLRAKTRNLPIVTRSQIDEHARKTIPDIKPIQCSAIKELRTTNPARCGDGNTVNEICATTGKKMSAPIHMTRDRSIRNRRKVMW